jgi:hypothetical protein
VGDLIDQSGRFWSSRDPRLARQLASRLVDDALAKFAVMNLGFASVAANDRFIRVACRPSILTPPTIIAMLHYVHDQRPAIIGFDYFTQAWNHMIVANRTNFRNLLFSLTCVDATDGQRDRLLRRAVDGRRSPLRRKLSAARRIFSGAQSLDDVTTPLDKLFRGRWSLHELNNETGHTVVREIGSSYTPLNPAWLATAVGSSLCNYADEEYGRWVADHHREALSGDKPLFDEVDAILEFPTVGRARVCYARLALPVSVRQAPRLVLSAAVSDSRIDLRHLGINKAS